MDKFQEMRVFAGVVDAGSFVGAADALGMSKAAVSRHVSDLEQRLGVRLMQRTTRKLSLTQEGEVFLARCRDILASIEESEAELSTRAASASGLLKVSVPVSFATKHLAPLWSDFLAAHPRLTLDVHLADRVVDLVDEGFDLAVRIARLPDSSLVSRKLAATRLVLCAAPSYLRRRGTPRTPADLEGHDCLSHLAWRGGHGWQLANGEQIDWEARLTCNDGFALREAAVAGAGLVLQPTALLAAEIAAGRLKPLLRDYLPEPRPMHLIYLPDRRPRPRLQCFVDFVMTTLGR